MPRRTIPFLATLMSSVWLRTACGVKKKKLYGRTLITRAIPFSSGSSKCVCCILSIISQNLSNFPRLNSGFSRIGDYSITLSIWHYLSLPRFDRLPLVSFTDNFCSNKSDRTSSQSHADTDITSPRALRSGGTSHPSKFRP